MSRRPPRRLPVPFTESETRALLRQACVELDAARTPGKTFCRRRDAVMLATGLYAGPRVSELCKLRVEDVDLDGAVIAIKLGKGKKDRNLPIADELRLLLVDWGGARKEGWLFPGPRGKKLAERTFRDRLAALGAKAGIRMRVHPHLMRHSFATEALRTCGDIRQVQELMGHANIQTTTIYARVDTSKLKKTVDEMFRD